VDLAELGPALVRPARLDADSHERAFGPHDVAVAGGVAVALAITDEDDGPPGGLVSEGAIALARPAHEATRMSIREGDRGAPTRKCGPCRDDRQLPHPERLEGWFDEEAEAVRDDIDRDPRGLGTPDERDEARVVRLR